MIINDLAGRGRLKFLRFFRLPGELRRNVGMDGAGFRDGN